jgi:hypothetical protein
VWRGNGVPINAIETGTFVVLIIIALFVIGALFFAFLASERHENNSREDRDASPDNAPGRDAANGHRNLIEEHSDKNGSMKLLGLMG